jgi:hypothetical protein
MVTSRPAWTVEKNTVSKKMFLKMVVLKGISTNLQLKLFFALQLVQDANLENFGNLRCL